VSDEDAARLHEQPVKDVRHEGDAVVVELQGELDLYNAQLVRDALGSAAGNGALRVVVDLGEVTFVDSTAMGLLIEARSRMTDRSAFVLASPRLETRRALQVSGLDRHFTIRDTVADALSV
jgi:anti-sigma B factor antagonist